MLLNNHQYYCNITNCFLGAVETRITYYKTFIQPHIDYCNIIWDQLNQIALIQKLPKIALRIREQHRFKCWLKVTKVWYNQCTTNLNWLDLLQLSLSRTSVFANNAIQTLYVVSFYIWSYFYRNVLICCHKSVYIYIASTY